MVQDRVPYLPYDTNLVLQMIRGMGHTGDLLATVVKERKDSKTQLQGKLAMAQDKVLIRFRDYQMQTDWAASHQSCVQGFTPYEGGGRPQVKNLYTLPTEVERLGSRLQFQWAQDWHQLRVLLPLMAKIGNIIGLLVLQVLASWALRFGFFLFFYICLQGLDSGYQKLIEPEVPKEVGEQPEMQKLQDRLSLMKQYLGRSVPEAAKKIGALIVHNGAFERMQGRGRGLFGKGKSATTSSGS